MYYRDRSDAGRRLAELLVTYRAEDPLVLALPRGGVIVGYEIARALNTELDIMVARKLGAPDNPEFGFGAIAPPDVRYVNYQAVEMLGLSDQDVDRVAAQESRELDRRMNEYRGDKPPLDCRGRTIILVDDGLATGATARAAIAAIRRQSPRRIILAVPVAPVDTAESIRDDVEELICPVIQADFYAIGQWYDSFEQVTDDEVKEKLHAAAHAG